MVIKYSFPTCHFLLRTIAGLDFVSVLHLPQSSGAQNDFGGSKNFRGKFEKFV